MGRVIGVGVDVRNLSGEVVLAQCVAGALVDHPHRIGVTLVLRQVEFDQVRILLANRLES